MTLPPVLILCGGSGKRARPYLGDIPKALAPVGGEPLIGRLLRWLVGQGATDVILGVVDGNGADEIIDSTGGYYINEVLRWSIEPVATGTVAAVRYYLECTLKQPDNLIVCNGDTLLDFDLAAVLRWHRAEGALLTTVCAGDALTPVGLRMLSPRALAMVCAEGEVRDLEALLPPELGTVYPVPEGAFVDVGTEAGWRAAQSWV